MKGKQLQDVAKVLEQGILANAAIWQASGIAFYGREAVASNGYIMVRVPFNSQGFKGYIKGSVFVNTLSMVPAQEVFKIVNNSTNMGVKSSNINMCFTKIEEVKNDDSKSYDNEISLKIPVELFEAIKQVLPFVGVREVIPVLRGVCVRKNEVIASDNVRIARIELSANIKLDIVIPFETAERLAIVAEGREVELVYLLKKDGREHSLRFVFNDGIEAAVSLSGLSYPVLGSYFKMIEGEQIDIPKGFFDGAKRSSFCQEGVDKILELDMLGKDLIVRSKGSSGVYEESYVVDKKVSKRLIKLSADEFLGVVENSVNVTITDDNSILFFQGKKKNTQYAMMTIEG